MKKFLFFFLICFSAGAQVLEPDGGSIGTDRPEIPERDRMESRSGSGLDSLPTIDLYKIISLENDTIFLDTTLTIQKDYKFNYLRKDNFELLPFSNTGQTYNNLSLRKEFENSFPEFGARARHYNFMEVEDIDYYHVPTPWTQLYFKTVPEQGQQLDAFFTINTSENFNAFIAYKGTRALGKYQHILTSTGNLRMGFSYDSKNSRYHAKGHFVSQDLLNEENGGLTDNSIQQYIAKEEEFEDRSVLDVNFENAENILFGKRFFLDHQYYLSGHKDSINSLSVSHTFDYSFKKYVYDQVSAANSIFGESFESSGIRDVSRLKNLYNEVSLNFENKTLGKLEAKTGITSYDYGYNSVYITPGDTIGSTLNGNVLHVAAEYQKDLGGFRLEAKGKLNLSEQLPGNYLTAALHYDIDQDNQFRVGLNQSSVAPNFNYLLYQSDYVNYNWKNNFDNEISQRLFAQLKSQRIANVEAGLSQIENFTYFGLDENAAVKPFQADVQVRYLKLKAEREFNLGVFGMHHSLMYQNVIDGADVLNLPEFVTRNSVYYQDHWFKKALYLQTGFTFKYFSSYNMNGYDPVLAEFYVQNEQTFGNFPVIDFFFNGKVDRARIFFKLQHANAIFTGNNNFSAPGYPYTDFLVRFGLIWDLFM